MRFVVPISLGVLVVGCGRIGVEKLDIDNDGMREPRAETETASEDTGPSGVDTGGEPIVHCEEIRPLATSPDIDGLIENGIYLEPLTPAGWTRL